MAYYKTIDGVKYDAELLELAEKSVAGAGDGRISVADAKLLFKAVIDGDKITEIEAVSIKYVKANYKWTAEALTWFDAEVIKWEKSK